MSQRSQADSLARPRRRRLRTISRPARVRMRARKPCLRARRRLLGWKVRFTVVKPSVVRGGSTRHGGSTVGDGSGNGGTTNRRRCKAGAPERTGLRAPGATVRGATAEPERTREPCATRVAGLPPHVGRRLRGRPVETCCGGPGLPCTVLRCPSDVVTTPTAGAWIRTSGRALAARVTSNGGTSPPRIRPAPADGIADFPHLWTHLWTPWRTGPPRPSRRGRRRQTQMRRCDPPAALHTVRSQVCHYPRRSTSRRSGATASKW